jgi:hypothetical protein
VVGLGRVDRSGGTKIVLSEIKVTAPLQAVTPTSSKTKAPTRKTKAPTRKLFSSSKGLNEVPIPAAEAAPLNLLMRSMAGLSTGVPRRPW